MSDIFFNIDNLITPQIEVEIENMPEISDKTNFLFKLIEYTSNFSPDVIDEIRDFWIEKTGEKYTPVFISNDEKELILEYMQYFPDFNEVKKLINCIATEYTKDDSISSAIKKIDEEKEKQKIQLKNQNTTIFDDLSFDEQTDEPAKHRQSLNTLLSSAETLLK